MSPTIKVTYFNVRALAETIRMLLKYGGIEFEDVRINHEDWPTIKETTPFGQVPTYEENGKVAFQSLAISRYLAKKVKLVGENDWENLEIDAIVDTISDLRTKMSRLATEKDENQKKALKVTLLEETFPYYLDRLEEIAKKNNDHLAIGKLTWADIYFSSIVETVNFVTGSDILEGRPSLKAVKDNVFEIPAIKDWVASRPKTDY